MTEPAAKFEHKPYGPYEKYFKRPLDFLLALIALIVLSPVFLLLTVIGAVAMKGNPFFLQKRAGRIDRRTGKERIFRLIKFRTMSNAKDSHGEFLPDEKRLNVYGRFLRSTSCDELPELVNIVKGDMAIVGPRPLVISYLPYYTETERHRHDVRPGLTGYAQIHGRNKLSWEEKFAYDLKYVYHISLKVDASIITNTALKVVERDGIGQGEDCPVSLNVERMERQ